MSARPHVRKERKTMYLTGKPLVDDGSQRAVVWCGADEPGVVTNFYRNAGWALEAVDEGDAIQPCQACLDAISAALMKGVN